MNKSKYMGMPSEFIPQMGIPSGIVRAPKKKKPRAEGLIDRMNDEARKAFARRRVK